MLERSQTAQQPLQPPPAEPRARPAALRLATDRVAVGPARSRAVEDAARRAIDIVVAAFVLLITSPVLLLAIIAVRLESPGAAIYRQRRIGRGGRPFTLYKLRGMYSDARERWPELYDYRCDPGTIHDLRFHPEQDPRVTRVGRFLRRTSID